MNRKDYWNKDYLEYWKSVTSDAEIEDGNKSNIMKISGSDYKSSGIRVATAFFDMMTYEKSEKLLDLGCGFGRFFSYFSNKCQYYGVDISKEMIEECKKLFCDFKDTT